MGRQLPPAPLGANGLANAVLGFIGVAGIRTIVVGIHQAVPFDLDHLIVFRPRFRLVCEYSRQRGGAFSSARTVASTQILVFISISLRGKKTRR
jgi:hypothetical protein